MDFEPSDRSLLETALDNINMCISIVDAGCNVLFWNAEAEKFYNIPKNEIVGRNIVEFFPKALITKVIKEHKAYEDVYNNPKDDYYIVINAVPLYDGDQKLIGGISIDRDITNYIKTEALLEKTIDNIKVLEKEINTISSNKFSFTKIIGKSPAFQSALKLCKDMSSSNISILLLGESGTGKEVIARAIHTESKREGPFIPINCSAIPANLIEAELFGYEGGAFTGAQRKGKIGKIEAANRGTLFLDEIGDMTLDMQPKILRVLETNIVNRLGSNKEVDVDIRVIGATNRNLSELVELGSFRQDLYYRLNSVEVKLPSLRERREDIELLANYFLELFCMEYGVNIPAVSPGFLSTLRTYEWNGNIRELKNLIERIVILHRNKQGSIIDTGFLPDHLLMDNRIQEMTPDLQIELDLKKRVESTEKETILEALAVSDMNITEATKLLNIPRTSLYYKLKKYDIRLKTGLVG